MKAYAHPDLETVPLHAVMQALSDPCRVAIVRELLQAGGRALACNQVHLNICKATRSHHFEVLREAGIIFTEVDGTKCMTSLRREELNRRFPGVLRLIAGGDRSGRSGALAAKAAALRRRTSVASAKRGK